MKKFLTKIIGATLGFAMVIGAGVGAANKGMTEAYAAGETWASVADTFALATSISAGDEIIIVSNYAAKAMGSQGNNNRSASAITKAGSSVSDKTVTVNSANSVALITVETTTVSDKEYYNFAVDGGYLYDASTSSKNYLKTQSTVTSNGYADWTVSFDSNGIASINARNASANNKLTLSYNTSGLFACYGSLQNNGSLEIYKKVVSASKISSIEASIKENTYYTGSKLSTSDFNVTVHWTEGKEDTEITNNFTWTINDVEDGLLKEGKNVVVVTYEEVKSNEISVEGTTIHATSVSVEEDTATIETIGETTTLHGSVLPAAAVEKIVWFSSDDTVAVVDENGVVTSVGAGKATITATAGEYSDACEVVVKNNAKVVIDFTKKDYKVAKPSNAQTEPSVASIGGYNFNLLNAHNGTGANEYLMIGTKQLSTTMSLVSNKTAVPGAIIRVVFKTTDGASADAQYNAVIGDSEITSTVYDETNTLHGKGTLTVAADASDNFHFFAISCVTSKYNGQIASVEITYQPTTVKEDIVALETQTTLAYRYEKVDDSFTYSDVSIRFGALVSKTLWDELDTIYNISGFGVMITTEDVVKEETIKAYSEFAVSATEKPDVDIDKDIADYFKSVDDMKTPVEKEGNYIWNLFHKVNEKDLDKLFVAAAYVKIGEEFVFLKEVRYSAKTLAADYLKNRNYDASIAEGSLAYLAK